MQEIPPDGTCLYCEETFTRGGMVRHLRACGERRTAIEQAGRDPGHRLHLEVRDEHSGWYWLHVEMEASAPLTALDRYLRAIWLECCGHLSQFSVGDPWRGERVPDGTPAGQVLGADRDQLGYVYDFGTEPRLRIRLVDDRTGPGTTDRPLALMARNEPPEISCRDCGDPATVLCVECMWEEDGEPELCSEHADVHFHPREMFMPVVNSPRTGLCGYTGPAEPPYV